MHLTTLLDSPSSLDNLSKRRFGRGKRVCGCGTVGAGTGGGVGAGSEETGDDLAPQPVAKSTTAKSRLRMRTIRVLGLITTAHQRRRMTLTTATDPSFGVINGSRMKLATHWLARVHP